MPIPITISREPLENKLETWCSFNWVETIKIKKNGLNFQIALVLLVKFHLLKTMNSDTHHSTPPPPPARQDEKWQKTNEDIRNEKQQILIVYQVNDQSMGQNISKVQNFVFKRQQFKLKILHFFFTFIIHFTFIYLCRNRIA